MPPLSIGPMPSHWRTVIHSPRKATLIKAPSTTLSLSMGATCDTLPSSSARQWLVGHRHNDPGGCHFQFFVLGCAPPHHGGKVYRGKHVNRRQFLLEVSAATAVLSAVPTLARAAGPDAHKGHQHQGGSATAGATESALAKAFDACAAAATACIAHCQKSLATGDKMMAECLKTALDCDALCEAVAKLARYESAQAPAIAKASIPAMKACADACKPHVEHHAVCKTCFDACNEAVSAANAV